MTTVPRKHSPVAIVPPMDVVAVHLTPENDAVPAAAALLSTDERERAARFVFHRDRARFIVARARLRQLLAERLGSRAESVELAYGARGKPALARRLDQPDVRFNVSHCADLAVFAFTVGREVGIDVETVRALPDADALAARFFSRRERAAYRDLPAADRPLAFFNCWTRKEAFIKAVGDGLSYPLDAFDVSLAPGEPALILRVDGASGEECGWCMESFVPAPGFVAAVVTERLCASDRSRDHSRDP